MIEIEEEAFAGIAAESVSFSSVVVKIDERAFSDNLFLREVKIPKSVTYIANNAFEGVPNLVIIGSADSYVAKWAEEQNVYFIPVDAESIWHVKSGNLFYKEINEPLLFSDTNKKIKSYNDFWTSSK